MQRVVEYGDEWMPIPGRGGDLRGRIEELQSMAKAAGRDRIPVSLFGVPPRADFVERMRTLEDVGVHRIFFGMPPADAATVLPLLRNAAEVVKG